MHKANVYLRDYVIIGENLTKSQILAQSLSSVQAHRLRDELYSDGLGYLYSSIVTFVSALSGIEKGFYSWPTVKFYYSAFYALRAQMAFNNICIFYVGNKPYSIKANVGEKPVKEGGNTHKCVIGSHKRYYSGSDIHTQLIDLEKPFNWLTILREQANYKVPKYSEPDVPKHLKSFTSSLGSSRSTLCTYLDDFSDLYTYDPDHAIVAMPLKTIGLAIQALQVSGCQFEDEDICYLVGLLSENGHYEDSFCNLLA